MRSAVAYVDRVANRVARSQRHRTADFLPDRPIVSFSFDDAPETALAGAKILEQHGARGTFYICGGLAGAMHDGQKMLDADACRSLAGSGHELACHTFSHRRARTLVGSLPAELDSNAGFFREVAGSVPRNFAFPYGLTAPGLGAALAKRFRTSRGVTSGINRRDTDLDYLGAVEIRRDFELAGLSGWIDEVVAEPGWLIFFTHDVSPVPSSYGCTPAVLEHLVKQALASDCEILTVDKALDRLGTAP